MANESSVLVRLRLLGGSAFARDAKAAGAGLGSIQSRGSVAERSMGKINKAMGIAGAAMRTGLAAGGVAAAAGIGYAVNKSVNFEQSMANVQARLGGTKADMSALSAQALDLGAKTQYSAQQAADAMGVLAQQGFNTQQIMKMMPGTLSLAAASGADLAQAADIQTEALHGFGLAAKDAGMVADVLAQTANASAAGIDDMQESIKYIAPVAKASGQNINDMMAAVGIMANVGIKGSQAGTTLRTAMVRLANPTEKARGALADLGLKAGDLAGKKGLLSMPNIMGKIVKGTQGVSKNTRNAALATIFGREALSGMVALVEKGPAKFKRMSDALENSKGAAKRTADVMRNTAAGAWDNLTGSVETAAIKLTRRAMPALKDTLNMLAGKVDQGAGTLGGFLSGVTGQAKATAPKAPKATALGQAGARPAPVAPKGAEGFGMKVRGVLGQIGAQAAKLGPILLGAGKQLIDAFAPAMPFLQNVLLPLLKGVAVGVLGGVVMAFKIAVPVIKILMTALGFIGKVLAPLKPLFFGIGVVIGTIAGGPILGLLGKLKYLGIVFRIMAVPIRVAQALFRVFLGAIVGLVGGFLRVLTSAQRFAAFFTSMPGRVIRAALNVVGGIVHTIETLPGKLVGIARRAGSQVISGLSGGVRSRIGSIVSFMGRVGKQMLDAIVNAIKAAPGALLEAIKSILPGGKLGEKVAGFLGIATGGVVKGSGWAVVGERGPELAHLPTGSTVYDARQTARARTAMAPRPSDTFVANLHLDGKQIHSVVFDRDRRLAEAT